MEFVNIGESLFWKKMPHDETKNGFLKSNSRLDFSEKKMPHDEKIEISKYKIDLEISKKWNIMKYREFFRNF